MSKKYNASHPNYYTVKIKGRNIECLDLIDALEMEHLKATALAYLFRAGRKGIWTTEINDLEKIIFYCKRRVRQLKKKVQIKLKRSEDVDE